MQVRILASGSTGNAYIVTDSKTTILLDAGIPLKKIQQKMGFGLSSVDGVLLSHVHSDHSIAVKDLTTRYGINAYMSAETAAELKLGGYRIKPVAHLKQFVVGTFVVVPFDLPHTNADGTECKNFGYLLYSTVTKERLLYATDCMYIPHRFPPLDYIMLETNYTDDVENDHRIPAVELRRFKSHMSLNTAVDFLKAQDLSKCKAIYCIHLSNAACKESEIRRRVGEFGKDVIIC